MPLWTFLATNPLLLKKIRYPNRLSLRVVAKGSIIIGITAVFVAITAAILQGKNGPIEFLIGISLIAFLLAIPLIALGTANSTVEEITRRSYELLWLTGLDNTRLAYGLLLAAFYRIRIFLFFALVITPILVVGFTFIGYVSEHEEFYRCRQNNYYTPEECAQRYPSPNPSLMNTLSSLLFSTIVMVGGWALILFGAAIGLTLGLWMRHAVAAGLTTLIIGSWLTFMILVVRFNNYGGLDVLIICVGLGLGWLWRDSMVVVLLGIFCSLALVCLIAVFPPNPNTLMTLQFIVVSFSFFTSALLCMRLAQYSVRRLTPNRFT